MDSTIDAMQCFTLAIMVPPSAASISAAFCTCPFLMPYCAKLSVIVCTEKGLFAPHSSCSTRSSTYVRYSVLAFECDGCL
jgi:hypothetical protein